MFSPWALTYSEQLGAFSSQRQMPKPSVIARGLSTYVQLMSWLAKTLQLVQGVELHAYPLLQGFFWPSCVLCVSLILLFTENFEADRGSLRKRAHTQHALKPQRQPKLRHDNQSTPHETCTDTCHARSE
ncbi:Uncharacterized protein HZ326_28224 [Fusarium oxysporum f. sp. albedinis]|nr:Uncharacterized protein HZ326_28224 [Fusarium oxysporum f. sp. albedinis]